MQAVAEMNEMEMENGKRIYVGRAQRKIERQGELRDKFEKLKEERLKRYQVRWKDTDALSLRKLPSHPATQCYEYVKMIWLCSIKWIRNCLEMSNFSGHVHLSKGIGH